jgi:ribonuclease E
MTKRMLIDASHAEETRVVVLDGNRLEDFDVETSTKRQLKGNIYLAKVVRVEPSLQAAFVEYGGGRHGFLAFDEIHPDYYQIPVADRQRLIEMQAEDAEREAAEEDRAAAAESTDDAPTPVLAAEPVDEAEAEPVAPHEPDHTPDDDEPQSTSAMPALIVTETVRGPLEPADDAPVSDETVSHEAVEVVMAETHDVAETEATEAEPLADDAGEEIANGDAMPALPPPETVGGESDPVEEVRERRMPRFMRSYKIQEVIKRRQILLVQVVKEERGTKGAALTTYISLAGRFCVLMPNSPRGGGISRKITSAADRRRLKEITAELEIPRGMGLIVRTAGANRPKPEIRRDCEYLLRLWDDIRDHTMRSVAPALIYEEASLIKRAIRDVYSRDVDEILVDGEEGWKAARDFMRMLMPAHAKKVILWRGDGQPLFAKHAVDAQLDAMLQPTVQLKSGGYLVINQTEALVAIDVNSGRSTRERGIEETALRTNLEAANEVARQLRLRDLAGLVVIDFIDMESKKHNTMVERRMKEALKDDRARIQVGSISHFGLLEMSRQRLRPSLAESSFITCPHCGGLGHVRSTESAAIHVLRHIEDEGAKRRAAEIMVHVAAAIAMYILNVKRERLREIEQRYGMRVLLNGDDALIPPAIRIDRIRAQVPGEATVITPDAPPPPAPTYPEAEQDEAVAADDEDEVMADGDEAEDAASHPVPGETAEEGERRRRRRRRRRGGRREDAMPAGEAVRPAPLAADAAVAPSGEDDATDEEETEDGEAAPDAAAQTAEDGSQRPRRRGRRGGRRRRREPGEEGGVPAVAALDAEQPELPPLEPYRGPTPADPFGAQDFDIFDVMDRVEQAAERPAPEPEPAPQPMHEPAMHHPVPVSHELEPEAPESVAPEPVALEPVALEPVAPEPEPVLAAPANDVVEAPAIRPIVIGSTEAPPVEKKRGWWRS